MFFAIYASFKNKLITLFIDFFYSWTSMTKDMNCMYVQYILQQFKLRWTNCETSCVDENIDNN